MLSLDPNEQIASSHVLIIEEAYEKRIGDWDGLLRLSVKENPKDGELLWRMGAWYSSRANWDEAAKWHRRNIDEGDSTFYRTQSMIYLSGLVPTERLYWLTRAHTDAPWRKEPWFDLAELYNGMGDWAMGLGHGLKALRIAEAEHASMLDPNWLARLHDIITVSAWHLGNKGLAIRHAELALKFAPNDNRLQNNLTSIRNSFGG